MKLDRKACELIANIENLIGTECFLIQIHMMDGIMLKGANFGIRLAYEIVKEYL